MIGKQLGNYRVEERIGAGGMGVVYRATDSKLRRQVAIKVLPDEYARDAERLSRFEREARLLAALNHPHIAAIYGLEELEGACCLVLEYVPGETLAERVAAGPMPIKEALQVCSQVADALEAAHAKGIIHRDLKVANVKITPEGSVKVLDFGLGKAFSEAAPEAATGQGPTMTIESTEEGMILGTAAYMSPEQARGKTVDRRADIWGFGCVLYETLTGKQAFCGETTSDLLVAILDREPDWEALPESTPANVRTLLRRCLQKDLQGRLRDIGDARLELEEALAGRLTEAVPVMRPRASRRLLIAAVLAGVVIGAAAVGLWVWRHAGGAAPPRVVRYAIDLPQGKRILPTWDVNFAFSPDSKTLLYPINFPPTGIHSRSVNDLESRVLPEAKGLSRPIYSPDGRWLAMADSDKGFLVKIPLSGGAPVSIAPVEQMFSGDWGSDGYIYWTNQLISGIIRTPENGGKEEPVTQLDLEKQERNHRFAKLLPGGKALIFTVASGGIDSYNDARIDAFDLSTKQRKPLIQGGTSARYSPSGHIVYARGGSLYAVPFDPGRLEVTGTPVKVLDGVLMSTNIGTAYFDISRNGDLAYALGPAENGQRTLQWVDRRGKATPFLLPARSYLNPRISPDGKLLAVEVEGPNHDFYVYDFDRAVMTRMTNDGLSHAPIWTPDGKRIAYRSWRDGMMTLWWMPADRSGPAERMMNVQAWQQADSFSPDGKNLIFDQIDESGPSVWVLAMEGDRKPHPLSTTEFPEGAGKFSPDGRWVLYCSMESGKAEIYVQPWPGPGPKIQISSEGGMDPMWSRDGKEIFYRDGAKMMAVAVSTQPTFRAGRPELLWEGDYMFGPSASCGFKGTTTTSYEVSLDGQRFLMIKENDQNLYATKVVVVLNWAEELRQIFNKE